MSAVEKPEAAAPPPEASSPGLRDRYIRRNKTAHLVYRVAVGVVGSLVVAGGIVLLPLPGPGWLIIFLGLGILASEFVWAERLLAFARRHVLAWTHWVARQSVLVRGLIGLGCVAIVAAALWVYVLWQGVPSWVPWIG